MWLSQASSGLIQHSGGFDLLDKHFTPPLFGVHDSPFRVFLRRQLGSPREFGPLDSRVF